ncbi:hypothetical protein [Microbulbifer marinus]|uniref:hypothetical protein n=1 Tax=Microbulbifer marinus TaxID=658218 RepID=UPI0011152769|nr:hypothetical protein [Microbulbifer marinus]
MATKRQRNEFDELLSRSLLFLIGIALLALAAAIFYREGIDSAPAVAFGGLFGAIGMPFIFVSILGSRKRAIGWANNTGNHEFLIFFYLLALCISYTLRKLSRKT